MQNAALTLLSKGTMFAKKKCLFFTKNADISKIKKAIVLKGIFFKTACMFVLTHQILSF